MSIDDKWPKLPLTDLLAQREALDARIDAVRTQTRAAAIAQVQEMIEAYGLRRDTVVPLTRASAPVPAATANVDVNTRPGAVRKKAPAKYYDPNSGNTWTGRGKPPRWIAGKDFSRYLIPAEGILRQMAMAQESSRDDSADD
ncbi:MAG: H-NS histone family protein [Desulfovibrionaceae bacterium]|jgi:DNA-binding protein H-NS|nr:H-NS histone family protein [Desulfovibrionaceae bacterium]